jgi:hypothetical protein
MQSNYDVFTRRVNLMVSLKNRVNLLNPEHEATGRVLWVALDKVVQVLLKIPLGGFIPRVVRNTYSSRHEDFFRDKVV